MNIHRHDKEGEEHGETLDHCRRRDIGVWKHEQKPREFIDHVEKLLVLIIVVNGILKSMSIFSDG